MTEELKRWLADVLRGLVGVQGCIINPPAGLAPRSMPVDLHVMLWTGVVVNIYVLDEPIKTRAIRQVVHQDTSQGVGVLFIIAPPLLPQPKEEFMPAEWLLALHALSQERIYTYTIDEQGPLLLQIHLDRLDGTERYRAIYSPPLHIERLNYGRVSIKPRFIKGHWLTAHFGLNPFWDHDAPNYVPPPHPQYQRSSAGTTSTSHQTPPKTPPPAPRRPLNRLEAAYILLGVTLNASEQEVKIAFRRRVFSVHPDVSALPKAMAEERFRALAEAYETIKDARGWK